MWALALAIGSTLRISPSPAMTVAIDATNHSVTANSQPLPVHIGGRVAVSPLASPTPKRAHAYLHEWPAVYLEAAFAGDRLLLKFDDDKNEYRLAIDNAAAISLPQPGHVEVILTGLGPGRHRVRLDKITESIDLMRAFDGFFVPPSETVLPAPPPRFRQIEFIGDSGMTGYGIRSTTRTCTKEQVRLRTDTSAAWPSLVARALDADYQINAVSGRGLVRNYGGAEPQRAMSLIYPRTLPDESAVWRDRSWRPQVIVVMLFNDFATELKPGERWPDQAALVADYTRAYQHLIVTLHKSSPKATLVLPWPHFTKDRDATARQFSNNVQAAVRAAAAGAGVSRIEFPLLPSFNPENSACDFHGSRSDHRHMAKWMTAWLQARPELWHAQRVDRWPAEFSRH